MTALNFDHDVRVFSERYVNSGTEHYRTIMTLHAINPATGDEIASYPVDTPEIIEEKIARAVTAFDHHRRRTFAERAEMMRRAADILDERTDRYARLMTSEMGKTLASAVAEVRKCALTCRYYAEHAEEFLADHDVATEARRTFLAYQPLGPVLAIMPWNFPFWQTFRFAAPALMAGNVGLLKHASNVPGSALAVEEVFRDAGFPAGCFQTLMIGSKEVGAVVEDERVAAVTLTGSEGAGRAVAEAAGRGIKKVVLELGGSDPFIVMPSADLDAAVATAVTARTINNGQSCIAAKRFILHEEIAEDFERTFLEKFKALTVGDPMEESTAIGPMARPEFVEELVGQIDKSIEAGAELLLGGKAIDRAGYYLEPTVVGNVRPGMPLFDEETFGPVAALIRVSGIDEAIATANRSRFGLGASAWTRDASEEERFVREIDAGCVFLNAMVKSDPRLPFGGVKASGIGRELGRAGIREFVNLKTIWIA